MNSDPKLLWKKDIGNSEGEDERSQSGLERVDDWSFVARLVDTLDVTIPGFNHDHGSWPTD